MQTQPPLILLDASHLSNPKVKSHVLRLLLEAADTIRADEATLWGLTADGQHLRGLLCHGDSQQKIEGLQIPIADSLAGTTFITRKTLRLGAAELANAMSSYVGDRTGTHIHAMLAAPVRIRGQLRGALTSVRTRSPADFTETDADTLAWKAFLVGLVFEWGMENREA